MLDEINKYSFKDIISSESDKPVVVMFHNNCVNCKIVMPILEELEKYYNGNVIFYSYETKVEDRITKDYHINKTPHICIFVDSFKMNDFFGVVDKQQIKEYIDLMISSIY